jgi:drug/metabolite transporter (DMT)-like permease
MSKRTFRMVWPLVALAFAGAFAIGRADGPLDVLRASIIGFGVTAVLLTVLLAVAYELRYRRSESGQMIRPLDVWGMGWSWILLLGIQLPQVADERFGLPSTSPVLLSATAVSVVLALYWLDRMVVRQIQGLTGH